MKLTESVFDATEIEADNYVDSKYPNNVKSFHQDGELIEYHDNGMLVAIYEEDVFTVFH